MSQAEASKQPLYQVGRYAIFERIAAGGMASVHLARLLGSEGFSRVVAVKRMHRHFLENNELKRMFVSEARLAARVRHPNVVPILDVIVHEDELVIVMDYVHGESLLALLVASFQSGAAVPLPVAASILVGALQGLHAAHEARDEQGRPLGIVHRDVSPHNLLVGTDGVARLLDFGVAKAMHAHSDTNPGMVKGKFSYMAPEVIRGAPATLHADIFSVATVFWELLASRKLFNQGTDQERLLAIIGGDYPSPRTVNPALPAAAERIVMKGLQPNPAQRYQSALEMAIAIERELPLASQRVVGDWVARLAAKVLEQRASMIHQIETSTIARLGSVPPPSPAPRPSLSPITEYALGYTQPGVSEGKPRRWPIAAGALALLGCVALGFALRGEAKPPVAANAPQAGASSLHAAETAPVAPPASATPAPQSPPQPAASAATTASAAPSSTSAAAPSTNLNKASPAPRSAPVGRKTRKSGSGREFLPNEL